VVAPASLGDIPSFFAWRAAACCSSWLGFFDMPVRFPAGVGRTPREHVEDPPGHESASNPVTAVLAAELADRRGAAAALEVRRQHMFDAHADRLVELFRALV
jgi:hypothetical protein